MKHVSLSIELLLGKSNPSSQTLKMRAKLLDETPARDAGGGLSEYAGGGGTEGWDSNKVVQIGIGDVHFDGAIPAGGGKVGYAGAWQSDVK